MFLNSEYVSSPESFSNESNDIKDLSPLIKDEKEFDIFSQEDFLKTFLINNGKLDNDSSEDSSESKSENKTKNKKRKIKDEVDESNLSEKDVKRQQRLIKNRESAQASRERRKNYVKNLEDNLKNMNTQNSTLSTKVSTLEEENQLLREQLIKMSKGEKVDMPALKKQKISNEKVVKKIPLPPLQQMPFLTTQYWTGFFNGGINPNLNTSSNTTTTTNQGTSPKVVLFMALFCIALFLVKNPNEKISETIDKKNIGRIIQNSKHFESINLATDNQLNQNLPKDVEYLFSKLNGKDEEVTKSLQEVIGRINLKFDTKSDNVTFVFPKNAEEEENSEITLSKNLFSEICSKLTEAKVVV
jgi:hypothetical protein